MQLFNEITACKAKMVEYTAEIKTFKEKLAAVQTSTSTSHQAPTSVVSPLFPFLFPFDTVFFLSCVAQARHCCLYGVHVHLAA